MNAQDVRDQAMRFLQAGKFAEAEELYLQLTAADHSDFTAYHMLGLLRSQQGRSLEALSLINAALATNPNAPEIWLAHGKVLSLLGQFSDALQSFDRALTENPVFAEALYNRGNCLLNLRRLELALASYEQALLLKPNWAEALNNHGHVLRLLGRLEEAVQSYDIAIAVSPRYALALYNRGLALFALRRYDQALDNYERALSINPNYPEALNNKAIVLLELNRTEEALVVNDKILASLPDHSRALLNRAIILGKSERYDEALETCNRLLASKPTFTEALNVRAGILRSKGQLADALTNYNMALAIEPTDGDALYNRALVLSDLERHDEALADYARFLATNPNYAPALYGYGNTLSALKRPEEAVESYERALSINPNYAEALNNRGETMVALKRFDDALRDFANAIAIKPDFPEAHHNRGNVLKVLGRLDDARSSYLQSLTLEPKAARAYLEYAGLTRFFDANDWCLRKMEAIRQSMSDLGNADQLMLDFALGKAFADFGDYSRSYCYLLSGNNLKRAQIQYNEDDALTFFDRVEAVFTTDFIERRISAPGGRSSTLQTPIFIFGMPRSGTTLVEQILASHPNVHAAGELGTLEEAVNKARELVGSRVLYPELLRHLSVESMGAIGSTYLAEMDKLGPHASHITNKMPSNYFFAGLIHLVLPNAHMIHVRRNPLDNCFSCYSTLFARGQNYTYDLSELGRYYKRYQKLMTYWARTLPEGCLLDVCYEDLVRDLEGEARRIISYCDLEWDPRCLAFHATKRPVETASASQVRRPIYRDSIGRALSYVEFLGPLEEALSGA